MQLLYLGVLFFAAVAAGDPDPDSTEATKSTVITTTTIPSTNPSTSSVSLPSSTDSTAVTSLSTSATDTSANSASTSDATTPVTSPSTADASTPATSPSTPEATVSATSASTSDVSTSATSLPTTDISTTTSILPPVDVNYVEFKRECKEDGKCEFTFVAPHNDQKVLAEERDEIDNDRKDIEDISKKIKHYSKTVAQSTTNAEKKIKELSKKLEEMKKLLGTYQNQLKEIEKNVEDAEYQLLFPQQYIDMLALNQQLCYSKCVSEPTTPAPTTTTTPPPTTPPSPCKGFDCNNGGQKCITDNCDKPYCEYCPGNLDGYQHCDTGACSETGISIRSDDGNEIPFFSPGFVMNGNTTAQANDVLCIWILDSPSIAKNFNFTRLDTKTSKLTFYLSSGAEVEATSKLNKKKLNYALSMTPVTIQFTAKKGSESRFYWTMTKK